MLNHGDAILPLNSSVWAVSGRPSAFMENTGSPYGIYFFFGGVSYIGIPIFTHLKKEGGRVEKNLQSR
jgi:hypothetical protein